jgi:hypothetical protein
MTSLAGSAGLIAQSLKVIGLSDTGAKGDLSG